MVDCIQVQILLHSAQSLDSTVLANSTSELAKRHGRGGDGKLALELHLLASVFGALARRQSTTGHLCYATRLKCILRIFLQSLELLHAFHLMVQSLNASPQTIHLARGSIH